MPRCSSIGGDDLTHCHRPESIASKRRLCGADDRPLIFADSGLRIRAGSAFATAGKVRPVPVLAALLGPFAGGAAERVATRLIGRFGTIDRMLSASDVQIVQACEDRSDIGVMIAGARALVFAALQENVVRSTVDASDPNLGAYLALKFRGRPHEELHAIFVDHEYGFISEELVAIGDANRVEARISSILRRALELGASGFFLVHNHPSNRPDPSSEDIAATRQISMVAHALDIAVLDHLIIAGSSVISMRKLNLL